MSELMRPTVQRRGRWLTAYVLLVWLLIAAIVVQVMLAGLAAFDLPEMWRWHVRFVNVLEGTALLLLLVALAGRLRDLRWPAAALLLLIGFQHGLAALRGVAGGFHAVVALVLIVLALEAARRASRGRDRAAGS